MASNNIIGIPANDSDFEDKCVVLFAAMCGDPNFKKVATRGKGQGGLDLIGTRDQDPDVAIGVQCKLVTKGGRLDKNDVADDIRRALLFTPPLKEIFVVTTASDDLTYDQMALTIRQEQKSLGRSVNVQIWGWDTLQGYIRRHPEALSAFDPDYSASTPILIETTTETLGTVGRTLSAVTALKTDHAESAIKIAEMHSIVLSVDTEERAQIDQLLDHQVDEFRDLLNNGKPRTALSLLEAFEQMLPAGASPQIRSRVRANIGFAKLKLGDDVGCATDLRAAFELNPSDEKAQANSLLADILEGHAETALSRSRLMLASGSPNRFAAGYVYQIGSMLADDINADDIVPLELRGEENAGLNRVFYLRKHRGTQWWKAAEKLAEELPESGIVRRFAAEAKLEQAFQAQSLPFAVDAGATRRKQLLDAARMLQEHWDTVRFYENAKQEVWLSASVNLASAYRALHQFEDAEAVVRQALAISPDEHDVLIASAHLDLIANRPLEALGKTERIADCPSRTTILSAVYEMLGKWDDVLQLVTPERLSVIGPDDKPLVDATLVKAQVQYLALADALPLIEGLVGRWPDDIRVRMAAAELASGLAPDLAAQFLKDAASNLTENSRFADRVMVAECAMRHADAETVIKALDGFVETDQPSEPLAWLALAFVNAPMRPRSAEFFGALGDSVITNPRFARLAGALACSRGDLSAAERHLTVAVDGDQTDLRSYLMLQSTLERAGKRGVAKRLICGAAENEMEGSPHDKMLLASLLAYYDQIERAFDFGYAIASQNRNDESVVARYPGIIFAQGTPARPNMVKRGGVIEVGDWFLLIASDGDRIAGLISNETTPEVKTYRTDNSIAASLLGAAQGQTISIEQPFGRSKDYVIQEVKSKYLWLFDDITGSHAAKFPGSSSMGTITMEDGDIQPVLDAVRSSVAYDQSIIGFYQQHPLPLETLAAMHRRSPIKLADMIVHYGGEIDTCFGSSEERTTALACVVNAAGKGAVLDTITAWCLIQFELLDPFKDHFGRLVIAQSTIDDLLELRGKEEMNADQEYLTLGFVGEQAVHQVHSPDDTRERIGIFDRAISKLREFCEVLPVDGFDNIELASLVHRDAIERSLHAIQLAKFHSLFLLSDDFRMRQVNDVYGSQKSAWIQATAQTLTVNGTLSGEQYARVIGRLAARKHGYISVNGQSLISVLEMDIPQADAYFDLVSDYIGGPKAEIKSHIAAVADFMVQVWNCRIPNWRRGRACSKLIENLIRNRSGDWPSVLTALDRIFADGGIGANMRSDMARDYLRNWISGHFLWPTIQKFAETRNGESRAPKRRSGKNRNKG